MYAQHLIIDKKKKKNTERISLLYFIRQRYTGYIYMRRKIDILVFLRESPNPNGIITHTNAFFFFFYIRIVPPMDYDVYTLLSAT